MTRKILIAVAYAFVLSVFLCCSAPQEPTVPLIILTQEAGFDDLVPEEEATLEPDEAPEQVQVEEYPDDPQPYTFTAKPGESVGLYSGWTKLDVEQLLSGLKISSPRYLKAGAAYTLVMSPERWEGFVEGRSERERKRRISFFDKKYIMHYRTHVVLSGENPGSIARKYGIPLWILEETNQNMEPSSLTAGEEVDVPIVAEKDETTPQEVMMPTLVPARGPDRYTTRKAQPPRPPVKSAAPPTLVPAAAAAHGEGRAVAVDEQRQIEVDQEQPAMNLLRIRIKSGETLGDIAEMANVSVEEIITGNKISNPNMLRVGQEIVLPLTPEKWPDFLLARERRSLLITAIQSYERRGFQVIKEPIRNGETAYGVAERVGAERSSLALLNPAQNFDALKPGQRLRFAVPKDTSGTETN